MRTSLEELLSRIGWVRSLARRLVRDPGVVEDVVQETLLAALRRPADAPPPAAGWIAKVVRSSARQRARSERAREQREHASARREPLPTPEELSARIESQRHVVEAVERLAEPLRSTVLLRYFDEIPAAEIARRQGLPAGTVRWRIKRAIEQLREDLDRRHGSDGTTWIAALAPLVGPSGGALSSGVTAAVLGGIMGLKGWSLAAAAAVVAGGAIWMASPGGAPDVAPTLGAADARDATENVALPRDELESAGPRTSASPRKALADGATVAPVRAGVRGRVVASGGIADDEELEVFALRASADYESFAHSLAREPWDEEHAALLARLVLLRANVAADGEFHLPVPEGVEEVHLVLRGRHLYLPATTPATVGADPVELHAAVGALVTGRLSGPAGVSLAGARVELKTGRGMVADAPVPVDLDFRCAADGLFEARGVPAGVPYTLFVEPKKELAAALVRLSPPRAGERLSPTVALDRGGRVWDEVVDREGLPVAGATVDALLVDGPFGARSRDVRSAATDASGRFELGTVPAGAIALRARKSGLLETKRVEVTVPVEGTLGGVRLELASGRAVAGTVHWPDGSPVHAAAVRVSFDPAWGIGPTAFNAFRGAEGHGQSDRDGTFRISGLGGGPFVLLASAERGGVRHSARRDGVTPEGDAERIVLHPPIALSGRGVDETGTPVTKFRVHAVRVVNGETGEAGSARLATGVENADGTFQLAGLDEGAWRLEASAPGRVTLEPLALSLPADLHDAVELVLHRAATVSGHVSSADGTPVAGATVRLERGLTALQIDQDTLPTGPETETDGEGRFTLEGLPPRAFELVASGAGFVASERVALQPVPGESVDGIELVLSRGAVLTGEVYDDQGEPAQGRAISVVQWAGGTSAAHQGETDAAGTFRVAAIPAGTWMVVVIDSTRDVSAEDDGSSVGNVTKALQFVEVKLTDGETKHVVIGSKPERPVRVYGRVRFGEDEPGEVLLHFHPTTSRIFGDVVTTVSGDDGTYECVLPRPGEWIVAIELPAKHMGEQRIIEFRRPVADGADQRLDFQLPTARVSGIVLGPDGAPSAGTRVSLSPAAPPRTDLIYGGQYAELMTDAEGRFDVRGLSAATFRLTAGGPPLLYPTEKASTARRNVTVALAAGQWRDDVELRLLAPGAVRARVLGPDGEPWPNATLFARTADGAPVDGFSVVTTDAEGRATLAGLAPGPTTFFARSGNLATPESEPVDVRSGREDVVQLQLEEATFVTVRLRGPDGPTPATLRVTDDDGRSVGSFFSMEDLAAAESAAELGDGFDGATTRVGPLVPGRYTFFADADGGLHAEKQVSLLGELERKVTLRMKD